jgi:hypothetical protein
MNKDKMQVVEEITDADSETPDRLAKHVPALLSPARGFLLQQDFKLDSRSDYKIMVPRHFRPL